MARAASPYADEEDLLLGDLPLSSAISVEKFIKDAADEIDVRIGHVYAVPVVNGVGDAALPEMTVTILRIANSRLASGRLLMAQAQAAQNAELHAYGQYLINEAETLIGSIASGGIDLEGVEPVPAAGQTTGPTVANVDSHSAVEAFYQTFMDPAVVGPVEPTGPVWAPGDHS